MSLRIWLAIALLVLVPTAAFAQDGAGSEASAEETGPQPVPLSAAPACQRAERLMLEVQNRQRQLDQQQREVDERERAIGKLEAELVARANDFSGQRRALEARIAELESSLGDQIGRLAKTYGSMDAGSAAGLLERLDSVLASSILRRMKHKKSAAILSSMPQPRAEQLSRILARPFDVSAGGPR